MERNRFNTIVKNVYNELPDVFGKKIDNVHIVVEDYPSDEDAAQARSGKTTLLGLYHGIPLPYRGSWYGAAPTIPDTITLYQRNIESVCSNDHEIEDRIYEVLLHEIGHYFGMTEKEIRNAMKNFK